MECGGPGQASDHPEVSESVTKRRVANLDEDRPGQMQRIFDDPETTLVHKGVAAMSQNKDSVREQYAGSLITSWIDKQQRPHRPSFIYIRRCVFYWV